MGKNIGLLTISNFRGKFLLNSMIYVRDEFRAYGWSLFILIHRVFVITYSWRYFFLVFVHAVLCGVVSKVIGLPPDGIRLLKFVF